VSGWKDLYLPVLERVAPALRPGALVVADNVDFLETRPYLARVRDGGEFVSVTLMAGRLELSTKL
jgi:predicted O-methyltransferase YrrM